jgi:polygalacturonase
MILIFGYFFKPNLLSAKIYDVKTFGAVGNGKALDTDDINKTIDSASAAGGGTVFFSAGTYLSYSIHLKNNISLYLDQGATLIGAETSEEGVGYDPPEPNEWGDVHKYQDFGHSHWHNSLIWGENLENISILGPGLIYGKGLSRSGRRPRDRGQRYRQNQGRQQPGSREGNNLARPRAPENRPVDLSRYTGYGNKAIALKNCRNVIIRDISFLMGGHFCILATGVDNLTLDNLKMDKNRDGSDIDCCQHVRISNYSVNSPNEDAIVLKSSFALGYARATENLTITNCQVTGYDPQVLLLFTLRNLVMDLNPDQLLAEPIAAEMMHSGVIFVPAASRFSIL